MRSDPLLMNHTWAPETEATFTLPVWPDPPNNEEPAHQGQIFKRICKEWEAQVTTIKEAAAAEAEEADKVNDAMANKDDSKPATLKPKQSVHHLKKKKPSKRREPLDYNLDDYFGPSQSQDSQQMTNVTPVNTPKKSEKAKLKNDSYGSSCRRVESHLSLPWSRNNLHRTLKFPASERPTSHLKAQLKRNHLNHLPNQSNLCSKQ